MQITSRKLAPKFASNCYFIKGLARKAICRTGTGENVLKFRVVLDQFFFLRPLKLFSLFLFKIVAILIAEFPLMSAQSEK